jgi:hypothetical protein
MFQAVPAETNKNDRPRVRSVASGRTRKNAAEIEQRTSLYEPARLCVVRRLASAPKPTKPVPTSPRDPGSGATTGVVKVVVPPASFHVIGVFGPAGAVGLPVVVSWTVAAVAIL